MRLHHGIRFTKDVIESADSGDEKFTSRSYEITYNWYVIDKYPYFGFNVSNTSPVFIRHPILPPDTIMMPRKKMLLRSLGFDDVTTASWTDILTIDINLSNRLHGSDEKFYSCLHPCHSDHDIWTSEIFYASQVSQVCE